MRLQRIALKPLSAYAGSSIEGQNAQLTLEGKITDGEGTAKKFTSIVFYTADSPEDRVHLTWGGDASNDEFIPVDTFWERVESGHYSGTINFERVGHTNSADKDGEVAHVDEVTVRGETYDFGAAKTIIPIDAVGQEGWKKSGKQADFTIGWTGDAVTFTTAAGKVDMGLKRIVASDIKQYRDAVIKGENAFFTVEMMTTSLRYTSVVFSSANPDQVILTWGSSADEYLTMKQFQDRIDSGALKGAVYSEHVGHINTGDTNGEEALVDEVSFAGTTYDFRGQPAAEGEGPDGLPTPELDAPAAEGEGPDGAVMPQLKPEATPEGDGVVDSEEDTDEELADTGAGGLAIALLGSTLLAAGGAATALSRRRG
jgi:hypothetical protein